jgi:NitT/TauT family transport system ATP-binding protein
MNSRAAPVVTLGNVGKTFERGTVALDGFNLNVRAGEFVSLLGPSGCGKSTALRIIAGLSDASTGTVETSARQAGDIGFVFQDPTLMPWARVADNVRLPLKLTHAQSRAEAAPSRAAVDRVLAQVGLSEFGNAFPRELSGGMKMRVSIARALVTEPHLLLMDEPFAALDEITRFKLNNDLLALWQELRRTVIFVTHSVFEAVYLSQRIVVMTPRPGRVFAEIDIPAPYPREDRYRMTPDYAGCCRQVAGALTAAMAEERP